MDLKSGSLYWPRHTQRPAGGQSLRQDIQCDVAVIGAGLTGALCAYRLAKAGMDVVALDKRNPGEGSTSASTALVLYDIDTPLIELIRKRGRADALRSYRCCREAIDTLRKLIREVGEPCEFHNRPSLYLASKALHLPQLKSEFKARKKAGLPVKFFGADDIAKRFSFTAPGAIYSPEGAEINPLRLTRRLIQAGQEKGLRVFVRTRSVGIDESRESALIHTASGHRIAARWVIVAAGYETLARAARRVLKLKSSYVLVTQPVSRFTGWHKRCVIWETARPYLYLRTTSDKRIMIGGGDEDIRDARRRDRLIPAKGAMLLGKLREMFPGLRLKPACCWAGMFGESKDGLPYVGSIQAGSRVLYALCYGANGTNFAVLAADILRDAILGIPNRDGRLFSFDR